MRNASCAPPPMAKAKASFVELVIQDRFNYADDRPLDDAVANSRNT